MLFVFGHFLSFFLEYMFYIGSMKFNKNNIFFIAATFGLLMLAFILFKSAGAIIESQSKNPAEIERLEKINTGFNQLRFANNSIEAEAIEAQLIVDLSQAKLASSNLLFENAQKLADSRDFNGALAIYQTIQKNEPDFCESYVNGAYMAFELDQKDLALAMLLRAVKIEPRHFAAWFGIGTLLDEKGDTKDAKSAYENALYYNPNFDAAERAIFAIEAKTNGIDL